VAVGRVAVIGGTGDEGFGLACRWAKAGIEVVIGSRDQGRADDAAERVAQLVEGARASGMENQEAATECDVIVVTVPFGGQATIYKSIADHVRDGAVVIDCTVPVAAAVGGRATQTLGVWEGSAAQQAAALLPKGTTLCASFHSLAAASLIDLGHDLEGDVLTCGSKEGKPIVEELVNAMPKLRYVDAGPLSQARIVEPITAMLIGLNQRYKTDRAGIQITNLPPLNNAE
jgi:NADPH-dependent F420 reductase